MWTMLWHLGHSRMAPIAASERTTSRAWQVVQVIEKIASSTVPPAGGWASNVRFPPTAYSTIFAGRCHSDVPVEHGLTISQVAGE
jgi:hypothetical protein